jgi:hypothetical protein
MVETRKQTTSRLARESEERYRDRSQKFFDYWNPDPTLEDIQARNVGIENAISTNTDEDEDGYIWDPYCKEPPWVWTEQQLDAYIRSRLDHYTETLCSRLLDCKAMASNTEHSVYFDPLILGMIKRVRNARQELFHHDGSGGRVLQSCSKHLSLYPGDDPLTTIRDHHLSDSILMYMLMVLKLTSLTTNHEDRNLQRLGKNLFLMIACVREACYNLFGIEPYHGTFFDGA